VSVAIVWYQKLCHFSVSHILSDWSNYGRQDLTDEKDWGRWLHWTYLQFVAVLLVPCICV